MAQCAVIKRGAPSVSEIVETEANRVMNSYFGRFPSPRFAASIVFLWRIIVPAVENACCCYWGVQDQGTVHSVDGGSVIVTPNHSKVTAIETMKSKPGRLGCSENYWQSEVR